MSFYGLEDWGLRGFENLVCTHGGLDETHDNRD